MTMPTMNVSLTPQLDQLVRAKVESGLYTSASEVVREALRLLDEQDRVRQQRLEELRAAIDVGLDQLDRGESSPWDKDEFLRDARARLAAKRDATESDDGGL